MKKVIATALAVTMLMANSISASAVTTGKWDFGAIRGSVSGAVQDIVQTQECQITYDFNGGSIWDFSSGFKAQTEYTCSAKGKIIDYTDMYTRIDEAMQAELPTMARYFGIGQAVAERPEKGAAVAAAEYIQKNWPDAKGYSPRNLRRMRELYRVYGDCPEAITLAEQVGWTQNVVILESDLDLSLRLWYMRATRQFGWSKLELVAMIQNEAHTEIVLDNGLEVCDNNDNDDNEFDEEITGSMNAVKYIPAKLFRLIRQRCRGKPKIGVEKWPITLCPTFMGKRTAFMRC